MQAHNLAREREREREREMSDGRRLSFIFKQEKQWNTHTEKAPP